MNKRIVLTTVGSLGDLHPFIAVALALRARGFDTLIAAAEEYRSKVENEGLAFASIRPSSSRISADSGRGPGELVADIATSGSTAVVGRCITPYIEETYADLLEVMIGADLVIASSYSIVARLVQAKLGLLSVTLLLFPLGFLSAAEPPVILEAPWLPIVHRLFGRRGVSLVFTLVEIHSRWHTRKVSRFRHKLGLQPARGDEVWGEALCADQVICLFSPLLANVPVDAPTTASVAGFSFYDSERGGAAISTEALDRFLAEGPAPLVFGLGSIVIHAAGAFYDKAAEVAQRLGMRAVLLVGPDQEERLQRLACSRVFVAGYAPHSLIFPRAAVVIHQGGIGTVGQAMRAGRPQLVCPYFGDQADNAERLKRIGVARRLDLRRFTVERAAIAIKELLAGDVGTTAAALGLRVALEDGAAAAAERVAQFLGGVATNGGAAQPAGLP